MDPIGKRNVFSVPEILPRADEFSERLLSTGEVRIERIISHGHRSPEGHWFDQADDEWVVLLQGDATLAYEAGQEVRLRRGDWLFIPARTRHRLVETSLDPPCIWLAVHLTRHAKKEVATSGDP